jgi:hypothetical protein
MAMLKHIGKKKDSGVKLAVIYMTLPDDNNSCLVADIDSLNDTLKDDLMEAIQSSEGQNSRNLYDLLYRRANRGTGTSILEALHNSRSLLKLRTDEVIMTPSQNDTIMLSELNNMIRKINDGTENKDDSEIEYERNVRKQQVQEMQEDERSNIGKNILAQAEELEIQAKMLMEEARRKRIDAEAYFPKKVNKKKAVEKPLSKEE